MDRQSRYGDSGYESHVFSTRVPEELYSRASNTHFKSVHGIDRKSVIQSFSTDLSFGREFKVEGLSHRGVAAARSRGFQPRCGDWLQRLHAAWVGKSRVQQR